MNYEDEKRLCEEIWENLITNGGYNGEIDLEILEVMRLLKKKRPIYCTDVAKELGLKPTHVELINYILATLGLAEYGTSPRGCWLTEKGEEYLKIFEGRLADEAKK